MRYSLSKHAQEELNNRRIPVSIVEDVLENPQQIVDIQSDKKIFQSQIQFGHDKLYLVRVIVNIREDPVKVITVYKTGKIKKYWREP